MKRKRTKLTKAQRARRDLLNRAYHIIDNLHGLRSWDQKRVMNIVAEFTGDGFKRKDAP